MVPVFPALAAKTKEFLESLGYTVADPETADNNTDPTLLTFKKDVPDGYKELIKTDLKDKFPSLIIKEETLPDDSAYDLLIIIGTSSKM